MTNSKSMEIEDADMPILFRLADAASQKAQKAFTRCMSANLILLVVTATLAAFAFGDPTWRLILAIIATVSMAAGIFLTDYVRRQRLEQNWYDGRAVAESVKTRAWRFMTCSEPYFEQIPDQEVRQLFLNTLSEVMKERATFTSALGAEANAHSASQITTKMMEIRSLPLLERRSIYLTERINHQRSWYSDKSRINRDAAQNWFVAIMVAQFIALVASALLIRWPDLPIKVASMFAAAAAAAIAWVQLKRHRELANSYGLASQELGFIAEQVEYITEPEKLSSFILDSENAISREHTLRIARRDNC